MSLPIVSLFSRLERISLFGACVITLGRANVVANVDPGNGSRYGGGGVLGFDCTDMSNGVSVLLDSLSGLTPGDGGEWYSDETRIRRSRRHFVVGSSLLDKRVSVTVRKYNGN